VHGGLSDTKRFLVCRCVKFGSRTSDRARRR
jgi:hypothetical protein